MILNAGPSEPSGRMSFSDRFSRWGGSRTIVVISLREMKHEAPCVHRHHAFSRGARGLQPRGCDASSRGASWLNWRMKLENDFRPWLLDRGRDDRGTSDV